jgi:hypothetical protein
MVLDWRHNTLQNDNEHERLNFGRTLLLCHYADCHYYDCCSECRSDDCCYAESCFQMLSTVMLIVIKLSEVLLSI